MFKFGLKMNSARSNVKLRGQMNSKFDKFAIHGTHEGIEWNQNQVIWNYNQRDILFSKSAKFWTKIGQIEEH